MNLSKEVRDDEHFLKNVFNKFRKKDFSGDTGQAMKNSSYQLVQNLAYKVASLVFTIIIARMLLPDRMGLYNLSISTIVLFAAFSDLGIGAALMTYCSRLLGKNKDAKAKGYAKTLFKWKLRLVFLASGILLASSYFIANYYYNKPIFFALIAGAIYIPVVGLIGFVEQMFKANENFRTPLYKEIILQTSRLIIVPLIIFWFLQVGLSNRGMIFVTILGVVFAYSIALLFIVSRAKKKIGFLNTEAKSLKKNEVDDLKKFIYPLSATALAGMFFGYVDTFMLGHFVSEKFIAFYGAAFSLVGGASAIIGFMTAATMPIFARRNGKALESIFRKTRDITLFISILAAVFTYFVAYWVVRLAYGVEYLPAVPILQIFSVLIVLTPLLGIYRTYFTTEKRTRELAWLIVGSAVLNIIFNFFGITYGLNNFGEMGAVYGACFATILSRVLFVVGTMVFRKK